MIIKMPMNLKNKTKEELISLLQDSCGIIEKLQKENEQLRTLLDSKDKMIREWIKIYN